MDAGERDQGGIFLVIIMVLAIAFVAGVSFVPELRHDQAMQVQAQTADDVDLLLAVKDRVAELVRVAARETPNALVTDAIEDAFDGPLGAALDLGTTVTLELADAATTAPRSEADLVDDDGTYAALACLASRDPCVDAVTYDGADDGILRDAQLRIAAVAVGMVLEQGKRSLSETFLVELEGVEL